MSLDSIEQECRRLQRGLDRGLFLAATEFARHEQISTDTVRRRAASGELPHIRTALGRLYPSAATSRRPGPLGGREADHVQELLAEEPSSR